MSAVDDVIVVDNVVAVVGARIARLDVLQLVRDDFLHLLNVLCQPLGVAVDDG